MPLSPAQFHENFERRLAATLAHDEQVAAELRIKLVEAVQLITQTLGPRRVILYGSLATGLFLAASSDVDLAVEGMGMAPDMLVDDLRRLLGRNVDLVDPDLVAPYIRRDITSKGIVLHEP